MQCKYLSLNFSNLKFNYCDISLYSHCNGPRSINPLYLPSYRGIFIVTETNLAAQAQFAT